MKWFAGLICAMMLLCGTANAAWQEVWDETTYNVTVYPAPVWVESTYEITVVPAPEWRKCGECGVWHQVQPPSRIEQRNCKKQVQPPSYIEQRHGYTRRVVWVDDPIIYRTW